jgi:hypothetical protein
MARGKRYQPEQVVNLLSLEDPIPEMSLPSEMHPERDQSKGIGGTPTGWIEGQGTAVRRFRYGICSSTARIEN